MGQQHGDTWTSGTRDPSLHPPYDAWVPWECEYREAVMDWSAWMSGSRLQNWCRGIRYIGKTHEGQDCLTAAASVCVTSPSNASPFPPAWHLAPVCLDHSSSPASSQPNPNLDHFTPFKQRLLCRTSPGTPNSSIRIQSLHPVLPTILDILKGKSYIC